MNIIARAAVYIFDGSEAAPIYPAKPGKPADEACAYLSAVADKLLASDTSRSTRVEPGSAQEELLRRFGYTPFGEAADALMRGMEESMQALEIPREGFDMVVFSFDRDNDPHLCVAQLPYRRAMAHTVEAEEDGAVGTRLTPLGFTLPAAGSKAYAGFVVNLSSGEIRLRDSAVLTNVGSRQLFSEALFAMVKTRSTRESMQAVGEVIEQAAPPDMPAQALKPALKRAMAKSIEEKGVIDVQDVAEEVFRSDPEREAIIESVSRQMREEAIEPVIPVESPRVMTQLQKVRIRTDNGISITLPRTLADDENSFAVVSNDDGTISIIISRVQALKAE